MNQHSAMKHNDLMALAFITLLAACGGTTAAASQDDSGPSSQEAGSETGPETGPEAGPDCGFPDVSNDPRCPPNYSDLYWGQACAPGL